MSAQDDFVPGAYMTWLKDTQDNVPSEFADYNEAKSYVSHILKSELGKEFDDVFEEFDPEPIGVASIGQVHRAVLRESHQEVAVKVQLPNMERRFRADIATLRMFCKLATPQFLPTFNEIEKQFCTEFDYRGEAENLNRVRSCVLPIWGHVVDIPAPHLNLCSQHLLVMDFLHGVKMVDGVRAQFKALAAQSGDTRSFEEIEAERVQAVKDGTLELKTLEQSQNEHAYISWMLFLNKWAFSLNSVRWVYNHTLQPVYSQIFGSNTAISAPWKYSFHETSATPLLDLGHTLKILCEVHASQILECGSFNGDPHPGNILLLEDGRLGLIDYGQVKTMSVEDRITFAKLIVAFHRDDKSEIVRLYKQMGMRTEHNNEDIIYRHACFYNDRDTPDILQGRNMHLFLEWMEREDSCLEMPENFLMAGRVTLLMRGMAKAFGLQIVMSDLWHVQAEQFLASHGVEY